MLQLENIKVHFDVHTNTYFYANECINVFKMNTEKNKDALPRCRNISVQRGAVFLQPFPVDAIINGREPRERGSQSDLCSHVNLRPTVSWLWQQDFTSIIQIPEQRQSALCQLLKLRVYKAAHGAQRQRRGGGKRRKPSHKWMKTPPFPSGWINRGHNHTLIRVNTPQHAFLAMHKTERHKPHLAVLKPTVVFFPRNDYANVT